MTIVIERHGVLPPVVERLTSGIRQAGQLPKQFVSNTVDMLRGRLVPYQGLGNLLPLFYESIVKQTDRYPTDWRSPSAKPKMPCSLRQAEWTCR